MGIFSDWDDGMAYEYLAQRNEAREELAKIEAEYAEFAAKVDAQTQAQEAREAALEKELEAANLQLMDIQTKGAYEKGHEHGVNAARQHVPSWENIHKAIAALEEAARICSFHDDRCGLDPNATSCDCGATDARRMMEAALKGLKT